MRDDTQPIRRWDTGAIDVVFVLLLMQGGFALVMALGTLAVALMMGAVAALAGPVLLTTGTALAAIVLGVGVARFRRWARTVALVFEWITLASAVPGLLLELFLTREGPGVVPMVTAFGIPAAVIALLMQPGARAAVAGRSKRAAVPARAIVWVADHPLPAALALPRTAGA